MIRDATAIVRRIDCLYRRIAAPVFNEFAEPIAGVSISGPTVRLRPERLDELGPLIAAAAAEVTRIIGGRAPG